MDSGQTQSLEASPPQWTERGTPAYRRTALALFLAGFATFSLIYCVQPLLPEFAREFRISPAQSSLALSLTTGLLAFSILIAGAAAEGFSRKQLMFASMAAAAVLNLIAGIAPDWRLLLAARAAEGVLLGGVPAVAMAYLAEEIHPASLGFAMGLYVGGTAFGGMVGRIGMGALTELFSWRAALGALGLVDLAAAIGFVLLLPASRNFTRRRGLGFGHHLRAWGGHLRHGRLPILFLEGFLVMGAFVTIYNYAGFRLSAPPYSLGQTAESLIFASYLFGMVSSSTAGAMADRLGRGPVLMAGLACMGAGVGLTLLQPLWLLIGGIVLLTIGFFIAHAVASGWVGRLAEASKGHAASLYLLAYYMGSSFMGSLGGWFWSAGGWPYVAAFTAGLLALGLVAALRLPRR